jgi:hypothetical protein
VSETLYCHHCCVYRPVTMNKKECHCSACNNVLQVPSDPETCPRASDGLHNVRVEYGRAFCSRCNAPVEAPPDAGVYLGGMR